MITFMLLFAWKYLYFAFIFERYCAGHRIISMQLIFLQTLRIEFHCSLAVIISIGKSVLVLLLLWS